MKKTSVLCALLFVAVCAKAQGVPTNGSSGEKSTANSEARIQTLEQQVSMLAEQGVRPAQSYLGFMFETGRGVPQNYTEAAMWYRRAAEQGDSLAQYSLGLLYDRGQGVPQDIVEANKWLNLSTAAAPRKAREARARGSGARRESRGRATRPRARRHAADSIDGDARSRAPVAVAAALISDRNRSIS